MATERRQRRLMDLPRLFIGVVKVLAATCIGIPLAVFVIAVLTKLTGNGSSRGWLGFFAVLSFMIAVVAFVWIGHTRAAGAGRIGVKASAVRNRPRGWSRPAIRLGMSPSMRTRSRTR
jgi:hypothetical protein